MALYKRGNTWWVSIQDRSGRQVRRSTGTADKKQATEYHDKLKAEVWRGKKLGGMPDRTWDDAAKRWLDERASKRTITGDAEKIAWLNGFFAGMPLRQIDGQHVRELVRKHKPDVQPGTRNRYYALIRAILRRAERQWLWLERAPFIALEPEPKGRVRWLTRDEIHRLLSELPTHLRDAVLFVFATGLRSGNVIGLKWRQVFLDERLIILEGQVVKNGETLGIPLNDTAVEVLRRQHGKHPEHVFTFRGRPVRWLNTNAWRNALKRAGIENFRFHDTRHVWASLLVQNGADQRALLEAGGWKSEQMVRRYAHLSAEHLLPTARLLDRVLQHDFSTPM